MIHNRGVNPPWFCHDCREAIPDGATVWFSPRVNTHTGDVVAAASCCRQNGLATADPRDGSTDVEDIENFTVETVDKILRRKGADYDRNTMLKMRE